MKVISGVNGSGKTLELIRSALVDRSIIVCSKPEYLSHIAKELGCDIEKPISYSEFMNNRYYSGKKLSIDNIESFLKFVSMSEVVTITITITESDAS